MFRNAIILAVLLAQTGCSAGQGEPESPRVPVDWPPGRYHMEGEVTYRSDSRNRRGTASRRLEGELDISEDGFFRFVTTAGPCREPSAPEAAEARALGRWTFPCQNMTFTFWVLDDFITAEASIRVREGFRETRCAVYNMEGVCTQESTKIDYRWATKRARLRVDPIRAARSTSG